MKRLFETLKNILSMTYAALSIFACGMAGLLLYSSQTGRGTMFALAVLLGAPVPSLFAAFRFMRNKRPFQFIGAAMAMGAAALMAVCYFQTPDGKALSGSSVNSIFTGDASYCRASAANLVPEVDQFMMATYLLDKIDPVVDTKQAKRIRRVFKSTYKEMGMSDEFASLGSVMNYAYRDLFLGSRPGGHLYEYIPETSNPDSMPVIIFLHGSLGAFKGYLWVWKEFADANGFAVVAPSFGAGNWHLPGGMETIENAMRYVREHPKMDARQSYIAGLSNGGRGVSRIAARKGDSFAGIILISPVMEENFLFSDSFLRSWNGRPCLILHGDKDRRIPLPYVQNRAAYLAQNGVNVSQRYFPGEDHFLFFSSPSEVVQEIASWVSLHVEPRLSSKNR